ncbi:MAG: restriction endonuclease subunit S, partial [Prevotella sp.]|nr:restriction endonuclease subunit S [Prevotella sp.]
LLKDINIPIPPLPIQEKIVSELDCINGILDNKRQQLKELNALAQSLFYQMFGDPINNEKGWEVKKLGEVAISDLGKTLNKSKDTGELRPYLCSINVLWNEFNLTNLKETPFENSEFERYSVKKGDLLICEGGDIGRAAIWDKNETMLYQNALHRVRFKKNVIPIYVLFFLKQLKDNGELDSKYGKGVTIKHLVKSSLMSIPLPLPPLPLQQSFASKIEAIEKQKAQIKQSIAYIETLLASRMQYWFD